jgi:hypothetical protein
MKIDYALLLLKPSGFTGGPYKVDINAYFKKTFDPLREQAVYPLV